MFKSYFTREYINSKNALINAVFSDRSDGKTFDCKRTALQDYDEHKWIRIYLRRYKTEITAKMYETFVNEVISKDEYKKYAEKYDFVGEKSGVKIREKGTEKWDYLCYFIPLTMASKLKSTLDISRCYIIDYDEFVPMDNKYLPDEIDLLLDFWKSVDRDRDIVKIFILANRIDMFNPFFDYFNIGISLEKDNDLKTYKEGTIAVQVYSSKEHREKRVNSRFGTMISGTHYAGYDNGGLLHKAGIKIRTTDGGKYFASFRTEKGCGSIWIKDNYMIISQKKRNDGFYLVDKIYNIDKDERLVNDNIFSLLFKRYYRRGLVAVEDNKSWYIFEDIIIKSGAK